MFDVLKSSGQTRFVNSSMHDNRSLSTVAGEFKGLFYYGSWYPRALVGRGGLVAGCGVGGRVVTRKEWQSQDLSHYSINEVVNKLFSKE